VGYQDAKCFEYVGTVIRRARDCQKLVKYRLPSPVRDVWVFTLVEELADGLDCLRIQKFRVGYSKKAVFALVILEIEPRESPSDKLFGRFWRLKQMCQILAVAENEIIRSASSDSRTQILFSSKLLVYTISSINSHSISLWPQTKAHAIKSHCIFPMRVFAHESAPRLMSIEADHL